MNRAALAFKRAIDAALNDAAHPHYLHAWRMTEHLARELRGGVPALLAMLDAEIEADSGAAWSQIGHAGSVSLHSHLMSVWVSAEDAKALKALTGRDREQWLHKVWWPDHAQQTVVAA